MGLEIEFKAFIDSNRVEEVKKKLESLFVYNGYVKKTDEYFSSLPNGEPLFRIRIQNDKKGSKILITSKPNKSKESGLEFNIENEFEVPFDQLSNLRNFITGLNLYLCRKKYKEGYDFSGFFDSSNLHLELLNVKYLGWFLEVEIISLNGLEPKKEDLNVINNIFRNILDKLDIGFEHIVSTGYYKMLAAAGHGLS